LSSVAVTMVYTCSTGNSIKLIYRNKHGLKVQKA
jgi:hypothetical protein